MQINRIYRCVLVLCITIQLALFFMAAAVGLWIDQLFNGVAGQVAWHNTAWKAAFIAVLVVSIVVHKDEAAGSLALAPLAMVGDGLGLCTSRVALAHGRVRGRRRAVPYRVRRHVRLADLPLDLPGVDALNVQDNDRKLNALISSVQSDVEYNAQHKTRSL